MKNIYLIRHSGPFVKLDFNNKITFEEKSERMILSPVAEERAKNLLKIKDLENIEKIYSCNSNRAISTIKYLAEKNDLVIHVRDEINEREFGVKYIDELPENFIKNQFEDGNFKLSEGESLLNVKNRVNDFINNILNNDNEQNIAISMHAIAIMAYFKEYCTVTFKDAVFNIKYNDIDIFNKKIGNPEIFKLEFDGNKLIDIKNIDI